MWDESSTGEKECFIEQLHLAMNRLVDLKFWMMVSNFYKVNKVIKACFTGDTQGNEGWIHV